MAVRSAKEAFNSVRKLALLMCLAAFAPVGPASAELIHFDRIKCCSGQGEIPNGWGSFHGRPTFGSTNSAPAPDTGYQFGNREPAKRVL